ncbi:MAG: FAD-dependent oxidoreductase [Deltaproteobacteria bacterium]|nr:FAD-dependent oxidoreductase [Deltaproteobacteria bacterium]
MTAYASVHDVVVVGAGLFGAAIARECTLRDLDVAIVERHEVAGGASSVGKVLLGGGSSIFGTASPDHQSLSVLAPHLVTQIILEGATEGDGIACIVDVTRLAQLYVVDAVERGATLLLGVEVVGSEESARGCRPGNSPDSPPNESHEGHESQEGHEGHEGHEDRVIRREVRLADGRVLGAGTLVLATGVDCPTIAGISSVSTRSIRTLDVATVTVGTGRAVDELISYPTGSATRVVLPTVDEEVAQGALGRFGLEGLPVLASAVHTVAVPDEGRRDGAPGLVHVTESAPGAHLSISAYLAETFARSAGKDPAKLPSLTPLPGCAPAAGGPSAALAERWGIPELSLNGLFARHGARARTVLSRAGATPSERAQVCACEAVLECEVRYACRSLGARSIDDVSRRTGLGRGACGGLRCAHRAAEIVRAEVGPPGQSPREASLQFAADLFQGRAPFLRAEDLAREEVQLARQVVAGLVDIVEPEES